MFRDKYRTIKLYNEKKMTKQKITKTQRIKIHHYNSNDDDDDGTIIIINGISINIQKRERKIYLWTTTTMTKNTRRQFLEFSMSNTNIMPTNSAMNLN